MLWSLRAEITETSPWHGHDVFEFVLCRGWGGRLAAETGAIDLRPARTVLIPPNLNHRFEIGVDETAQIKVVCIPALGDSLPCLSSSDMAVLDRLRGTGLSVADHPGREAWLDGLGGLITDGLSPDDPHVRHVNQSALSLLLALHEKEARLALDPPGDRHGARIGAVLAWIEANLGETLTIDRATALAGLSRSLLTREFRRHTGQSFVDYCNTRRVRKAAVILGSGAGSVTEAAYESGFSNLSHFHRQFKAHFGLTPAAFRRKALEDGAMGGPVLAPQSLT